MVVAHPLSAQPKSSTMTMKMLGLAAAVVVASTTTAIIAVNAILIF